MNRNLWVYKQESLRIWSLFADFSALTTISAFRMATPILASHGFIQSSLHSLLSSPFIALAEAAAQGRFSETHSNLGSTYVC